MKMIYNFEKSSMLDRLYNLDIPFIVAKKEDLITISDIVEKERKKSVYADALMQSRERVLVDIVDGLDDDISGYFAMGIIFVNRNRLNDDKSKLFKNLVHEYTHFLQDVNVNRNSLLLWNKWAKAYKNNVQDFYLKMINEADAFTKEELIFSKNLTSEIMNKTFFKNLKLISSLVNNNYDSFYHIDFDYTKIKMRPEYKHEEFKRIIELILKSGTSLNGAKFPQYSFSFSDIDKILGDELLNNRKFDTLVSVNKWDFDEARMRILPAQLDYFENMKKEQEWKAKLDYFCRNNDSKKMKNLLNNLYGKKEL